MELNKFKSKLSSNGIELSESGDVVKLSAIKISLIKFWLITALSIPGFLLFLKFGTSILGFLFLGVGLSCLYNGIKSSREVMKFNSSVLEINNSNLVIGDTVIPIKEFKRFKAGLSTNPLFPNINVEMETQDGDVSAFTLWRKNKKYLNEDKYEIVKSLNKLISEKNTST